MYRKFGLAVSIVALAVIAVGPLSRVAHAADHREAPGVNGLGEGDIGDIFAFVDPNDRQKVVVIMGVNPFAVPAVQAGYKFSNDFLYQWKFDTDQDFREDFVVQAVFRDLPPNQTVRIFLGSPELVGRTNRRLFGAPVVEGPTGRVVESGDVKVFTGLRDDPFVVDIGQLNRILNNTQDVFRGFTSPVAAIGALRGRSVRPNGASGTDGFGGFNGSFIAVSFPVRRIGSGRVNIWGTVNAPVGGGNFLQFERMGQQVVSTVFVPLTLRDTFNAAPPDEDVARFSGLIPDALTISDNDGTGNTIAGRRAVLTALGVTSLPNGAPLLLPERFENTDRNLLRRALLPDVLRLDLDLPSNELAIGQFGLQNGRRPADDVVDILLRLARELADVNFPAALGVPGSGPARPGALNLSDRRVFAVLQGTDFYEPDANIADLSDSGNERPISQDFPYLPAPHPLPGAATTVGFPPNP